MSRSPVCLRVQRHGRTAIDHPIIIGAINFIYHAERDDSVSLTKPNPESNDALECIAQITAISLQCLELEALTRDVYVSPPDSDGRAQPDPTSAVLLPHLKTSASRKVLLLRPKDTVFFPGTTNVMVVVPCSTTIVQVNSSVPTEGTLDRGFSEHQERLNDASAPKDGNVLVSRSIQQESSIVVDVDGSTPLPTANVVNQSEKVAETPHIASRFIRKLSSHIDSAPEIAESDPPQPESQLRPNGQLDGANDVSQELGSLTPAIARAVSITRSPNANRQDDLDGAEHEQNEPLYSHVRERYLTVKEKSPTGSEIAARNKHADKLMRYANVTDTRSADPRLGDDDDTESDELPGPVASKLRAMSRTSSKGRKRPMQADQTEDSDREITPSDRPPKKPRRAARESQDSLEGSIAVDTTQRATLAPKITPKQRQQSLAVVIETSASQSTSKSRKSSQNSASSEDIGRYNGTAPRVVFSNSTIPMRPALMKFFKSQGGTSVETVNDACNFLCVGIGELKKTGKLLLAVALGKQIVTDSWISRSAKAGHLLDPAAFVPSDPQREKEWGFNPAETVGKGRRNLLKDKSIYLTPALKKSYGTGFKEIEDIASKVGAEQVISKPARDLEDDDKPIILALEHGDIDAVRLQERGFSCYHKDLLSTSILRGRLDLDSDEFKIVPSGSQSKKAAKRRKTS